MTSIGVLGGSFNPPHRGHLALARAAVDELGLEKVLLVPALIAPHKPQASDPGTAHRLKMCELLAEQDPKIEVSTLELERQGPSYTVDTLRAIHRDRPGDELTLILGADMARTLPAWREPVEIASLAKLAVATRDGTEREAVEDALSRLGAPVQARFLAMAPVEVSSSQARAQVAAGEPCPGLLTDDVERYIRDQGLYR